MHAQPNVLDDPAAVHFSARFWGSLVLIAVLCGLAGGVLMHLLYFVQHASFGYSTGMFVHGVETTPPARRLEVLVAAGMLVGLAQRVIRPMRGGHAGQVTEAIWFHSGDIPLLATVGRAVSSIVVVGMGAAIGREGAFKQVGAAIGARLAARNQLSHLERRLLAACGTGAGIAAAYNVPLGGGLFAAEVLVGSIDLPVVLPTLLCAGLGTCVAWLLLPATTTYHNPSYHWTVPQLGWALVMGPVMGLVAVGYVRMMARVDAMKPRGWKTALAPVGVLSVIGAGSLLVPQLLGNGKDLVQLAFTARIGWTFGLLLLVLRPLATASCVGAGVPGGLFTPTISCGALLGTVLGEVNRWTGEGPGPYAVMGAGAFLAAATQAPVSSVVLILELGEHLDRMLAPLLLAITGATLVARWLSPMSIYTARVRMGKTAVPEGGPDRAYVSAAARYGELLDALLRSRERHVPLLVVDEEGHTMGQIPQHLPGESVLQAPVQLATAADLLQGG